MPHPNLAMTDFTLLPIHDLLARLRGRELSARELAQAQLERIQTLNPRLNAIIALDAAAALAQAAESDERYAQGTARPLEGLPITLKDAWDVRGFPSVVGDPSLQGYAPAEDAIPVAHLRAAGAVILGKTNVPCLCGDFQTYNEVYGVTNNPWRADYSPGGSSGGAAAAVASGMSAFELGSDLGGSIRWPATVCGVFGLKPTWGLVPMQGHTPPKPVMRSPMIADLAVAGPLARAALDLDLILPIIAQTSLKPPRAKNAADLRVAVWLDDFAPVDSQVARAVELAARMLENDGARVDRAARPNFSFAEVFEVYGLLANAIILAGVPQHVRNRLAEESKNYAPDDLSFVALQARAARFEASAFAKIMAKRKDLRAKIAVFFQSFDAILAPVACAPALRHDAGPIAQRVLETDIGPLPYFDLVKYAALASALRLPAAAAPIMLSEQGTPIGVQILCAENEDRSAIAIAAMLERTAGRFSPPQLS